MDYKLAAYVVASVVLCFGCSAPAVIDRVDSTTRVLAFGDSLTFGYGASQEGSYPSALSKLLNCEVGNYGINGEDTTAGLRRLPEILEQTKPDLVLLCHGGNDMLRKQPLERTKRNLEEMISLIKAQGSDIILIAVPQPGLTLTIPELYEDLAKRHRLPIEKKSIRSVLRNASLKSDMIHPNSAGYEVMADRIYELILKSS